jgi:hypothetical protein
MKLGFFTLILFWCAAAFAESRTAALTSLHVFPPNVNLTTKEDQQSLVVQAVYADGVTRDVTTEASFIFTSEVVLARLHENVVMPVADGTTELRISYGGQTASVPVKIEQSTTERPISFTLDVIPALTKGGCNSGGCHGSSSGKDGFHLSLFGFDPEGDHYRLTKENIGRRINLALPEESLLLEKATGKVPHTGGQLFTAESKLHETFVRWLKAGAPKDPPNTPKPVALEILPRQAVLEGSNATQRLTVRATYSDGTDRDVTSLAAFFTNNESTARVSPEGIVTSGQRGEAFVMARLDVFTVGAQILVIPRDLDYTFPEIPEHNYIDTLVHDKLKKLRIVPSELSSDATFLRRVYIDITGTLPTPDEMRNFVADTSPSKRERVISELLDRPEFVDLWVMKWAELLQIRSGPNFSYKNALSYYNWLREQVVSNVPVDQMVKSLLTATDGSFGNPPSNYYKLETDPLKISENVAQVFMGIQVQCAQCHNHPFDRWTMNDYYGFASFFSQIGRKTGEDPRETIIFNRGSGEVQHPVTKQNVKPKFLGGDEPDVTGKDRREALAGWLASRENPYFARNLANIVWAHFMGRGIVEPVDDVRVSNPPSNPELLDALTARFIESNYDFKQLVRDICSSRTYQLSTRANESNATDESNFSKAAIRRMRAEVLHDTISQVTETEDKFQGLPRGARSVQIADGNVTTYFLTTFGRAKRETVCSCEVSMEPNLSQALHLLNGDTVNRKVTSGGVVTRLLKENKARSEIIEELYLRSFGRPPEPGELEKLEGFFQEGRKPDQVLTDLFWALLNSKEFIFNR